VLNGEEQGLVVSSEVRSGEYLGFEGTDENGESVEVIERVPSARTWHHLGSAPGGSENVCRSSSSGDAPWTTRCYAASVLGARGGNAALLALLTRRFKVGRIMLLLAATALALSLAASVALAQQFGDSGRG
jgi:hypothetical protein